MRIPLVGGLQQTRETDVRSPTQGGGFTYNMIVEPPTDPDDNGSLMSMPGLIAIGSAVAGSRQINATAWPGNGDLLYVIAARRLYTFNIKTYAWTDLSGVDLANLSTASPGFIEFLGISAAGVPSYIVFGSTDATASAYYYDVGLATTTALSTLGILGSGSTSATYLDGRVIIQDQGNTGRFYYSNILTPVAWSALNFATAEGNVDSLRAVLVDKRELYLFGSKTTEIWFSTGDANAPYQRFQGGMVNVGLVGPQTARRFNGTVAWLSRSEAGELRVMMMGEGYAPKVISNPGINALLAQIERPEQCWAFVFQLSGHEYYCLQIPYYKTSSLSSYTFVYDAATEQWYQWGSNSATTYILAVSACAHAGNMTLGTSQAARIFAGVGAQMCYFTDTATLVNGVGYTKMRTTPRMTAGSQEVRCRAVELDFGMVVPPDFTWNTLTLGAAASAGATTVTLSGDATANGYIAGRNVQIYCTNGWAHMGVITSVSGNNITMADHPLPYPAPSGAGTYAHLPGHVYLSVSHDGANWSSYRKMPISYPVLGSVGFQQSVSQRLVWNKLGWGRDWWFRFTVDCQHPFTLKDAYARFVGERDR